MISDKYDIIPREDNEWVVYQKDKFEGDYLFKGTLEEVNAWISLKEKGFNI